MHSAPKTPPAPWRRSTSGTAVWAGTVKITQRETAQGGELADPVALARLITAAPQLFDALHRLVAADNVNYWRDTMRYAGYFDDARAALTAASGESYAHPDAGRTRDPLIWALTAIAEAADDVAAVDLQQLARQGLEQSGVPTQSPALDLPAAWPAPAFQLGETVYVWDGDGQTWHVAGLRYEDYGPLCSSPPQWVYRLARRSQLSGQERVAQDRREYEAQELARTPWCACSGFCRAVATTTIAGESYCDACAAGREP